ncbi:hypothetical protein [Flaviaesturariibacter aridisoli]|uniref:Uncharacterized protein n=1 Tax=Flaviaesturariibacter aridisoli TaxID=2545761 RepID=A0A4R4DTC5_9BACT|nr:hypothetical protein [Flaviaesturariibacter aridisoli]TCZ65205.1 hypothetical protein E0486_17560 [Flaviaesturariibacter aridisoli]
MTAEYFVGLLAKMAPSKEALTSVGFDYRFVEIILKRYRCSKRLVPLKKKYLERNVLIELLCHYDCSTVMIGNISLESQLSQEGILINVGSVEADQLMINEKTEEIILVDQSNFNHVICKCAQDAQSFLEALLIVCQFLTYKMLEPGRTNNSSVSSLFLERSIEAAGGKDYYDFYSTML